MNKSQREEVAKAYKRAEVGRAALIDNGCRCMEVTEDGAGIVWERYLTPRGRSLILFATPTWWDVFEPVHDSNRLDYTLAAIERACSEEMPHA